MYPIISPRSARHFIRRCVAPFEIVLAKHMLGYHIRRPDEIAWIVTGKMFFDALAALIASHTNYFARLQRNRHDHTRAHVRAAPPAGPREKFRADLEL